jgi:hypothetical protein
VCGWPGGAGDPTQGALGDCWFIAAMSLLATRDDALAALFCGMGRTGPCARGVYAVRFCKGAPAPRDWVVGVGRHDWRHRRVRVALRDCRRPLAEVLQRRNSVRQI